MTGQTLAEQLSLAEKRYVKLRTELYKALQPKELMVYSNYGMRSYLADKVVAEEFSDLATNRFSEIGCDPEITFSPASLSEVVEFIPSLSERWKWNDKYRLGEDEDCWDYLAAKFTDTVPYNGSIWDLCNWIDYLVALGWIKDTTKWEDLVYVDLSLSQDRPVKIIIDPDTGEISVADSHTRYVFYDLADINDEIVTNTVADCIPVYRVIKPEYPQPLKITDVYAACVIEDFLSWYTELDKRAQAEEIFNKVTIVKNSAKLIEKAENRIAKLKSAIAAGRRFI